jgi:hypothetical protein
VAATTTLRGLARRPARRLRRAFVPEYEDVLAQLGDLQARTRELADLAGEVRGLRERLDDLQGRVHLVEDGLLEARRLNLRLAQLTDVVTELVLPLHDRDIDPAVLDALPGDTR